MVLVTGGTGYIGSHTVVELQQNGYEVVIADNLCNSKIEVLDYIKEITGIKPAFEQIDVCDYDALTALFDKYEIESVIHFAGLKAVGESVRKPVEYYTNNLVSTLNLCKVMRDFSAPGQNGILDRIFHDTDIFKECHGISSGRCDGDNIVFAEYEVPVRDNNFFAADDLTNQDIDFDFLG